MSKHTLTSHNRGPSTPAGGRAPLTTRRDERLHGANVAMPSTDTVAVGGALERIYSRVSNAAAAVYNMADQLDLIANKALGVQPPAGAAAASDGEGPDYTIAHINRQLTSLETQLDRLQNEISRFREL